jgi:hypothetical protein
MRVLRLSMQFAAFITLFIFLACTTSTKFSTTWKDETYQGPPTKILVINAFPNPANRRLFEDEIVMALKDRKVDAVVSYTIMPDPIVSDKDAIAARAMEVGADTVLINRPLGIIQGETIGAGATYIDVYVNTQTDVYNMKSNKLILSATAETWIRQGTPYSTHIKSYIKDLVQKLSQQGLFLAYTSTKFSSVWKDETYQGPPTKILVINMFQEPSLKRIFDDEIVKALKDRKVDAVVKYTAMPPDTVVSDKDAIAAQAKEVGADTVLITRPAGARMDATGAQSVYINTQTDVYDMKTNKLISFASAETQIREGSPDLQYYLNAVPSYAKDLVKMLSKAGLF